MSESKSWRTPDGGVLIVPPAPTLAVLVLGGSSGQIEGERAEILAAHGMAALAVPWFGAPGQPDTPRRVQLDTLIPHLDQLTGVGPRIGVLGTSFGAEAALLLAVRDPRLCLVAALAPTAVVWETTDMDADGQPVRDQKWTWQGRPVAGVPYVDQRTYGPFDDARSWHEASLDDYTGDRTEVTIPVEEIEGDVLLAAGGDDKVWQAAQFADAIITQRQSVGRATTYVFHPRAGHRLVLPGEAPAPNRPDLPRGGTPDADSEHGHQALAALLRTVESWGQEGSRIRSPQA